MNIEHTVSGYIVEDSIGSVEFDIDSDLTVTLEDVTVMGASILHLLTEDQQEEITGNIRVQMDKDIEEAKNEAADRGEWEYNQFNDL